MQLGSALETIRGVELGKPLSDDVRAAVYRALDMLRALMRADDVPLAIPASRREVSSLMDVLEKARSASSQDEDISYPLYSQSSKVVTILQGELAVQAVYYVWPKRAYDINILADRAVCIFASALHEWFTSDELSDIDQAGKCLAYELGTAAAFHLIRAAESVIRRYYQVVVGSLPKPKMRSWGVYVTNLRKHEADPKVVSAIEQVKEFHRNPVMHPEEHLSTEDALSLLGIVESLISAIHRDMSRRADASSPLLQLLATGPTPPATLGDSARG